MMAPPVALDIDCIAQLYYQSQSTLLKKLILMLFDEDHITILLDNILAPERGYFIFILPIGHRGRSILGRMKWEHDWRFTLLPPVALV